jgi:simple sugar transport system permease protein
MTDTSQTPTVPEPAASRGEPEDRPPRRRPPYGEIIRNVWTAENGTLVTILAIVCALVVGAVMIVLSDTTAMSQLGYFFSGPGDFLSTAWHDIANGYRDLFEGSIFNPADVNGTPSQFFGPITSTLEYATPLIFGGLSVTVAFRAGMFNIGGQGQIIIGAIFTSYAAFTFTALPGVLHMIVSILAGMLGGLLLGAVVGWLKARRGAHEVIVTIMLNYVMSFFLAWVLYTSVFHDPSQRETGVQISKPASHDAVLPHLFGPNLNTDVGLLFALAATFIVAWFFKRSKLGFEIKAVGLNPNAARTAGVSVARVQIYAFLISGALMGLVGVTQTLGLLNPNAYAVTTSVDAGLGFNAITVALLGRTRPWGVVGAAVLFGALEAGGSVMQTHDQISVNIITVIQALIVIFVAAPKLIKEIFRLRAARVSPALAGGKA